MGWLVGVLLVVMDGVRFVLARAGAMVGLFVVAGFGNLAWNLLPPYVQHYRFKDEVVALAAAATSDDSSVRDAILRAAERQRIPLQDDRLEVRLQGHERTVHCGYEIPVTLLPKLQPRLLRFDVRIVQPAFARDPNQD